MEYSDIIIVSEIEPEYDFFEELITIEEQKGPSYEPFYEPNYKVYGTTGPTGCIGVTGSIGCTGPIGPIGTMGPKGTPGLKKSSYSSNSVASDQPQLGQVLVGSSDSIDWAPSHSNSTGASYTTISGNNQGFIGTSNIISGGNVQFSVVGGGGGGYTQPSIIGGNGFVSAQPNISGSSIGQFNIIGGGGYFMGMGYSN